jgi:preprotein translocase subunit SecA
MKPDERRAQYACDVTYCCNKELAFDYLRDRIALGRHRSRTRLDLEKLVHGRSRSDELVLRGLCFGIVDEADSVLVDEAKTPLIISAGKEIDDIEEQVYETAVQLAARLEPGLDFEINHRERAIRLTESGEELLEELAQELRGVWKGPNRRSQFVGQALSALHLFERDKHYLVNEGQVQIIDEYTGRLMPDRSWERGLHQMIEAKEGCEITGHTDAQAKISYQRFFTRYQRLAGMTGTAKEIADELWSVYHLATVKVPTHRPVQRRDLGQQVHATAEERWDAVVSRILALREQGRAILVGTRSVAASEHLSARLEAAGVPHQVLNARQDAEEAEIVAAAGESGRVTVATNMAGRGTDIELSPETLAAGGLHVIATERHEARRIDRQLFGRCGRQGDPGSFEEIVSLEDELVTAHAAPMAAAASAPGSDPHSKVRRAAVRVAQRRAEALHAKIRRRLLEADQNESQRLAFSGRGE